MSGTEEMDFGMGEAVEVPSVTVSQLDELCEKFADLKKEADELDDILKEKNEKVKEIGTQIINFLNEFKKPSWKTSRGNFIISNRFTVPTPKSPEDKQAFFNYLKQKGIFEDMVTVHSQTLNGYYRQEMDAALDAGDVNFSIPGIEEPKYVQTLSMRKK
jgi:hypothetical protein